MLNQALIKELRKRLIFNFQNEMKKPLLFGAMMTAGSAIGAGMFSLPLAASGMWFPLTLISLFAIWALSYLSSLMIMEVSLEFPIGSSFNTFTNQLLGKSGSIAMGISIGFLLYILLYAYFSAFGNMAMHTLDLDKDAANSFLSQGLLGFLLGCALAAIVWMSTVSVGRISTILVVAMAISFIISISGTFGHIDSSQLFRTGSNEDNYFSYLWAGLPYFITSFGFSSMVPSLYKYYGKDVSKIKGSLLFGSLLALLTYLVWISVTFGILSRNEFIPINAAGNVGDLVGAMEQKIGNTTIQSSLNLFSNFAIISSFLGVGLNLFDYIADRLGFDNSSQGRFYTACITFLPPGLASFFFPHGFHAAIGFAGIVIFTGFFLIPFLMVWKLRTTKQTTHYQLFGGKPLLILVLILSMITAICHVLAMLDYLPKL